MTALKLKPGVMKTSISTTINAEVWGLSMGQISTQTVLEVWDALNHQIGVLLRNTYQPFSNDRYPSWHDVLKYSYPR